MPGFQFENHSLEIILLAITVLVIFSIFSSKLSSALGVPALLIFLGVGMLAGSEGPGGIDFDNYKLAFAIGSVSLALIIFDGGMRTSWRQVRPVLPLSLSLSFFGVLITAVLTGAFAHFVMGIPLIGGILLGSIVSSTDAAAVFSILRARSLYLRETIKNTLEFEAGSNDPTAIFLTVSVLAFGSGQVDTFQGFVWFFAKQAGLGVGLGLGAAFAIRWIINSINLEYEGLYNVLMVALVLSAFAAISSVGGSGFLAAYVIGLYLGNTDLIHKRSLLSFHDGIAWLAQISVFLTLGLLSFPSKLVSVWREGLILSIFMMIVARPVSVMLASCCMRISAQKRIFISWVGLRGAAPIILATLPWAVEYPDSEYYFNLVFFVVLMSVLVQGMSIPWLAKRFSLTIPQERISGPAEFLPSGYVAIEARVTPGSNAIEKRIVDLHLPSEVLFTSIERDGRYVVPRGNTVFSAGDRILGLARPPQVEALKEIFGAAKITNGQI